MCPATHGLTTGRRSIRRPVDAPLRRRTPAGAGARSVRPVRAVRAEHAVDGQAPQADVTSLIPMVRRIIAARVRDDVVADDLVQETLARVLAAAPRVEAGMLEPYAIVTARNVVASLWREQDRHRRNQHRVVDLLLPDAPDTGLLAREEQSAVARASCSGARRSSRQARCSAI